MFRSIWIFDGFTSSSVLINYLSRTHPDANITWSNHVRMKHGIDLNLVPETTDLLIVPDAGSNNYKEHKILRERGVDVLIVDHHEANNYSEDATVINIQLDDYPNKQISGVGVVFKLIQQFDKKLGVNFSPDYRDLLAFGLLGDAMKISEKETFWYVKDGLANVKNEFLKEIIKENVDKGIELTPKTIAFKCNPKINSLLRVGTQEELDELMKAFLEHQEVTINSRLRSADKSETWCRRMTRICNNTYARQRRIRDKVMEEIENKIEKEKLYENQFIIVEVEGDFILNMSGYVAISLVQKYRKPCIVLRKNEEGKLSGSLRGYDPLMMDTKDFLKDLNLFSLAEGHQNACGLEINELNFKKLDETINHSLQDVLVEEEYIVDFVMNYKSMTKTLIEDMEKYSHVWGRGIEEPKYAITSIEISGEDLQLIGKAENVIKFVKNGVEYVQFVASPDLKNFVGTDKLITIDVVGSTGVNSWRGNKTYQLVLDAVSVKEVKDKSVGITFEF